LIINHLRGRPHSKSAYACQTRVITVVPFWVDIHNVDTTDFFRIPPNLMTYK